jgi:hypothetical protein
MTAVIPVAFAGLARSGKTTAAEYLENELGKTHGVDTVRLSFAGPIREGLEVMGVNKEDNPVLYRHLAQLCGDDSRNPNKGGKPLWWIDLMRERIQSFGDHPALDAIYVLIDDVRYPNELDLIQEMNGVVFYVDAAKRVDTSQSMYQHASEEMAMNISKLIEQNADVQAFKGVLDNNGSIVYYIEQLGKISDVLTPENYLVEIGVWK